MEVFLVYLWLKLDSLHALLSICLIIGSIALLITLLVCLNTSPPWERVCPTHLLSVRYFKRISISCIIMALLKLVIPTSLEMAYMVGTSLAVSAINSEEGKKVTTLIRRKANQYLDQELKEHSK